MRQDVARAYAPTNRPRLSQGVRQFVTFTLSAFLALALMANAVFERFDSLRLGAAVAILIVLQTLVCPWLLLMREFVVYGAFAAYMMLSLLWAPDPLLGMNSVLPALDFVLILVLFASLLTYGGVRPTVDGAFAGLLAGAVYYTASTRFPFIYPENFPYNAAASMYLFGLFITCLWGWNRKLRLVPISVGLVLIMLIASTTSIKTNLGVLLGIVAAGITYRRRSWGALRRNALQFIVIAGLLLYAALSSQAVIKSVEVGLMRVSLGTEVLTGKDKSQDEGATQLGLGLRERWESEGVAGWVRNPVFGYGVEAFRADIGITSHSTPVDLLYNFGLIGFGLFYSIFAVLVLRLIRAAKESESGPQPLIFGGIVCYVFISLSGTMFYNAFLAAFIATSCALLRYVRVHVDGSQVSCIDTSA